jgi:hypothetical protein
MKAVLDGFWPGLLQKAAIVVLVLICSIIAHKGYVDISALGQKYSGQEFRVALARYFIGNLAGGGKAQREE